MIPISEYPALEKTLAGMIREHGYDAVVEHINATMNGISDYFTMKALARNVRSRLNRQPQLELNLI
jgi:hypothetical protein